MPPLLKIGRGHSAFGLTRGLIACTRPGDPAKEAVGFPIVYPQDHSVLVAPGDTTVMAAGLAPVLHDSARRRGDLAARGRAA